MSDHVTVTTVVAVPPVKAFDVFTREIDRWWRRGPRFRWNPHGALRFEDGRLVEVYDEGHRFEVGRVLAWEPATRLGFEFRARDFAPHEKTEVEVRFEAVEQGTRVTVEHRGWGALVPDHPARHGWKGDAFANMMAGWWADLLVAARVHAAARG